MLFNDKIISLFKGRVSSARVEDNGDAGFIFYDNGALIYKKIPKSAKQISFTSATTVSYGDDCFKLHDGLLHRRGDFWYEKR